MKTSFRLPIAFWFCLSAACLLYGQQPANSGNAPALPSPTPYVIVQQDANSQVWRRVDYETLPSGKTVPHIHQYTELATGLNHLVNGQWVASKEEIDISPDGNSAAATNGQHQVYFPGDIAQGVIELVTPDGKQLQSRPIGLSYDDGSNTVLIAILTNSPGYLFSANQVIYPNAFTGVQADLLYTYTKAGFEQDIILRAQPPTPESFGLNPQTARLQVLTEFFNPPQPTVSATTVSTDAGDLTDDNLDFGTMQMGRGNAFLLGTNSPSVAVKQQWVLAGGRQLLVEEVPVMSIADELSQLPLPQTASIKASPPLDVVSIKRLLPAKRLATVPDRQLVRVAQAVPPSQGLVLDYLTINSSQTNYTFRGDTTYYISGPVNLYGTNTFEGGTVIKYTNTPSNYVPGPGNRAYSELGIMTAPQILASAYRPVILTAKDDNSVGETISSSTGDPTNYYAYIALDGGGSYSLQNMRIAFAQEALGSASGTLKLTNVQMINCRNGVVAGYRGITNPEFGKRVDGQCAHQS